MSQAAFGKKIVAVDDRLRPKKTEEFVNALNQFVFSMSVLMSSLPFWKFVSTKKWREFKEAADKMLR